ncbi:MAG: SoxR reducing system RseC family protein [Bacteroidales bacterium]|jgi:sigma-E factor negative regulatory protein RseC|nr:SoxR reducing system RseC family protein [Bacteroidales bacterium]MDD3200370.1 SoxR reducing system RseC family protein [Bacteroidales bacterium]
MSKKDSIIHDGVVVGISEDYITVEFVNKSACAACRAKGVCAASDESIREIDIPYSISTLAGDYHIGDPVNIILSSSLGLKAVWIAYVIPLAILLVMLLILSAFKMSELIMGLGSVAAVAVYYLFVYIFRNKLSKVFTFSIEKKLSK